MARTLMGAVATTTAVLVLLFSPLRAHAQVSEAENEPNRFGDLIGSLGAGSGSHGVALAGALSLPAGPGDVAIRATNSGFGEVSAGDFGLLYGFRLATGSGRLWARASAGPAWSTRTVQGEAIGCRQEGVYPFLIEVCDYEYLDEHGAALAFQVDGAWELGRDWGLGTTWFSSSGGPGGLHGWSVNLFWRPLR